MNYSVAGTSHRLICQHPGREGLQSEQLGSQARQRLIPPEKADCLMGGVIPPEKGGMCR